MFDFVHENKKAVQIVLALIILPFAFWGVDSYNRSGNSADIVASVNDEKITRSEFENATRQQQERMRQMMGSSFDAAMLDTPEMKKGVVDNLVSQHLLVDRANASKLAISDEQVAEVIQGIEVFHDNGKFDNKRYEAALANQRMSPLMFEQIVRNELTGQQMRDAYAQNGYASNVISRNIIRLNEQQRVVSISQISFQPYLAQAKVDDAALKKYYDQNQKEFHVQEQAKVEYVKLSVDSLMAKADVKTEEIRSYYDEHQSEFGKPEERRAAHILITVAATAPKAEQDAAKAKAEQLLQQAQKTPSDFATLAKQNSQDPGSAANGGDLGFFGHGMMVKPFEEATYKLKPGEISGLVKSDFGYHIIKLLEIKTSRVQPFDEAREGILNKVRKQKATDMFAKMAESFNNAAYEQSDSLKAAATLIGAKIEQSDWLIKGASSNEPWTAKMLQAIFSDDTIKDKRNTAAIEVAPNTLVSARILEHKPAATRKLEEVQDIIRQKLTNQQASELASKQGKKLLEQLQKGEKVDVTWATAQTVTHAKYDPFDQETIRKIFQADPAKLPQYVGSDTPQGYMLMRIEAMKDGDQPGDAKLTGYTQKLRQMVGDEMLRAYIADAKQQAKIKITLPETASAQ